MQPVAECVPTACLDADFPQSANVQLSTARSTNDARSSPPTTNLERDAADSEQGSHHVTNVGGVAESPKAAPTTPPGEASEALLDPDSGASVHGTVSERVTLSSLAAGPPSKHDAAEGVKMCAIDSALCAINSRFFLCTLGIRYRRRIVRNRD